MRRFTIKPTVMDKAPIKVGNKIIFVPCPRDKNDVLDFEILQKKEIVKDSMHGLDIKVGDVIPSPKITEYRRKIQYPVSQTKDSKRIIAGYYKPNSHELVNIKYCPIQPKSCDEIIEYVRNNAPKFGVSGYQEKLHAGDLRHIVIRSSELTEKNLVIFVINSSKILDKVKNLALQLYKDIETVSGVGINLNPNKTNLILGDKTTIIDGNDFIEEKLCDKIFKVGADTFFQINPTSANNIFEYVKKYISENYDKPMVLDAYAGITTFGICLSNVSKKVVSVEENKASVDLASKIIKQNGIENVELHNMDASMFFEKELKTKGRTFDVTVLDPPRKGCTKESLDYALKLTKSEIIYVSCNPSTLARDLKYLVEKGCKVDFVQPFDMFPHTYHIENVAIIKTK